MLDSNHASVDGVDGDGETPLHFAARGSNVATVNLLLSRGAHVNAQVMVAVRMYACM